MVPVSSTEITVSAIVIAVNAVVSNVGTKIGVPIRPEIELSRTARETLCAKFAQTHYYSNEQNSCEDHKEDTHSCLVAAAAATTAGSAATEGRS